MYKTLGIYIHIPFCAGKCNYCDFNSFVPKEGQIERYIDALAAEIKVRLAKAEKNYTVNTVFIGGGTPSYIKAEYIVYILERLKEVLNGIRPGMYMPVEVTVECNPGTVDVRKLEEYRKAGINRISIGLQSASDEELRLLGRIHTFDQWKDTILAAGDAGFDNISTDLISGIPGQTPEALERTLDAVIAGDVCHISVYSLIIEEGTLFYEQYRPELYTEQELDRLEENDRILYALTKQKLTKAGYNRYEISNYSKPGYECKHNLTYWTRGDYMGFGISAASLVGNVRITNTADYAEYVDYYSGNYNKDEEPDAGSNISISSYENIQPIEQMAEYMILGLRLTSGVSYGMFRQEFGCDMETVYGDVINKWIREGYLVSDNGRLYCTDSALDVCNIIMADFI